MDTVREHWKKMAHLFGTNEGLAMEDPEIRSAEEAFIFKELEGISFNSLLDLGCGNGTLLKKLYKKYPTRKISGIEWSPELLELAKENNPYLDIRLGDIRDPLLYSYDVIITKRVVINLLRAKEQESALKNIESALNTGGSYLMIESFKEGFNNLQKARLENAFYPLKISQHNRYISLDQLKVFKNLEKVETNFKSNHLSTHFFIKRVLHPLLRKEGTRVKDTHLANFLIEGFGPGVGEYSPIQFFHFKKI